MTAAAKKSGRRSARTKARAANRRAPSGPGAVKMLVLDCDGVLTDGVLVYGPGGEVLQRFSVYDGYGLECLRREGVEVAVLTGRRSAALTHRAQDLGIRRVVQGATDKAAALLDLAEQCGVKPEEIAYVGDDVFDIPHGPFRPVPSFATLGNVEPFPIPVDDIRAPSPQLGYLSVEASRRQDIIRIQELDHPAAAKAEPVVSGGRGPGVPLGSKDDLHPVVRVGGDRLHDLGCVVGRSVIHHYHFDRSIRLRQDGLQRLADQ